MIAIPQKTVGAGYDNRLVSDAEAHAIAAEFLGSLELEGKRILLIVPDATSTAPVEKCFIFLKLRPWKRKNVLF